MEAQLPTHGGPISSAEQPGQSCRVFRDLLPPSTLLQHALLDFFITKKYRIVWTSRNATTGEFTGKLVLAAHPWREGTWQQLARIDWVRGTVKDDKANAWWAHLYDTVPVLRQLGGANVTSTNTKGNVVEACVGASFLASHELLNRRFHFRTEPPDIMVLP